MEILFFVPSYPSKDYPLPGLFHKTQAEALVRLSVNVRVVAPAPWIPGLISGFTTNWLRYHRVPEEEVLDGISIRRPRYLHVPRHDVVGITHFCFSRAGQRGISKKPDLIHAHFAHPAGLAATAIAKRLNIPCVLTLHGSDVHTSPLASKRDLHWFKAAVSRADMVIAVSGALARRTEELTGRSPKVLPIGIDLSKFSNLPSKEHCRNALHLPQDRKLVLYAGDLLPSKGIPELIEALRLLNDERIRAVIVGTGRMKAEVAYSPQCISVGEQSNERIPFYMQAADLIVLPSHAEGMPTVLVEAGAAQLPVLATTVGGIPELLAEDRGYLIPPYNPPAIAEGIRRVLFELETEPLARADRLRWYVLERYSAEDNVRQLIRIYEELMNNPHRRHG